MNKQQYKNNETVYMFYFEWESEKLKYRKAVVVGYNYLNYANNIKDEYKLLEVYTERKNFLFKKTKFRHHTVHSHIISNNIIHAKLKFLYYFLKDFKHNKHDNYPNKIENMLLVAQTHFEEIIEYEPELILKVITERLIPKHRSISYWTYE